MGGVNSQFWVKLCETNLNWLTCCVGSLLFRSVSAAAAYIGAAAAYVSSYMKIRLTQPNFVELGLRLSLAIYGVVFF